MPRPKVIGFRPTQELKAIIDDYKSAHSNIKKDVQAVIAMITEYPTLLSEIQRLKIKPSSILGKVEHKRPSLKLERPLEVTISPLVSKEVDRLFRGQHSPFVEALCNVTEESVSKSFTIAGKRGIITVIPTRNP